MFTTTAIQRFQQQHTHTLHFALSCLNNKKFLALQPRQAYFKLQNANIMSGK